MARAVATLFRTFARAFGPKWRATFEDPHAPMVWERKFRVAGISAKRVLDTTDPATDLEFPPSLGEFITMCRDLSAPSLDDALREALQWCPSTEFDWSHPAIGAVVEELKYRKLHTTDDRELRAEFARVYRRMLDRYDRGKPLKLPECIRALPELRTQIPPGAATPPAVAESIAKAARLLGFRHD